MNICTTEYRTKFNEKIKESIQYVREYCYFFAIAAITFSYYF